MRAEVRRCADAAEFDTSEGCAIAEVANDAGDDAVSIARARVPAGRATRWHVLDGIDERYVVVAGCGLVELQSAAGETLVRREVTAGDVVRIPAGVLQRITSLGAEDLVFWCVCSPRFRSEAYRELDDAAAAAPNPPSA